MNTKTRYCIEEMKKIVNFYKCKPKFYCSGEIFAENENEIEHFSNKIWNEIIDYLTRWKKTLPDAPEINFDANSEEVFEELKNVSSTTYKKL